MAEECETAFWKSMEELVPIFEREGLPLHIEAHPDDFIEDNNLAVDIIQAIGSPVVKYLYCAPHTYYLGDDMAAMIRYAAPVLAHVHVADTFNHKDGWRYVMNPPPAQPRASISTSTSAKAKSIGTSSSRLWPKSASTAS